jgi:hypothetical protein
MTNSIQQMTADNWMFVLAAMILIMCTVSGSFKLATFLSYYRAPGFRISLSLSAFFAIVFASCLWAFAFLQNDLPIAGISHTVKNGILLMGFLGLLFSTLAFSFKLQLNALSEENEPD